MQTWEYKLVEVFAVLGQGWVMREDGQKLPGQANILAKAKELGSQGWEMYSGASGSASIYEYWFKRMKP